MTTGWVPPYKNTRKLDARREYFVRYGQRAYLAIDALVGHT